RPDLLTGHVERVAAQLGAGPARREIRAGVRLREALAPDLVAGEDAAQKALLLRFGAVVDERRSDQPRADADVDHVRRPQRGVLLGEDELLDRRRAAPAVFPGPVEPGPPALEQAPLPLARERDLLGRLLGLLDPGRAPARREVGHEPIMYLAPEARFAFAWSEVQGATFRTG